MIGMTRLEAVASALLGAFVLACGPAEERPAIEEADAAQAGSAEEVAAQEASDLEALRELHEEHINAARNKDIEAFMATVTDAFVLLPPGDPGAAGAEAVREWIGAFFESGTIQELEFTSVDYTVDGDWAVAHYRYDWTIAPTSGEPVNDVGQGLYVYRRQPDGSWLIAYDVWNSDGPPAQEP